MALTAIWTPDHRLHQPRNEVWIGIPIEGDEVPERGDIFRDTLVAMGVTPLRDIDHGTAPITAVHDSGMVAYLETAFDEWLAAGYVRDHGQDRIVSYVFPHPDATADLPTRWPESRAARAGVYCMDTTTVIGPGTYRAAVAAAQCALTAADQVLGGARASYAGVRPPGHHAGSTFFGGSCYLNNTAIASQYLIDHGVGTVAVIDIDAHHGNGTQQIFYRRPDVFYTSVHIDPATGWFPHFAGYSDEAGAGEGRGWNLNLPLQPGDGDQAFVEAVERACVAVGDRAADVLVVSAGVDSGAEDVNSPLFVTTEGFAAAGDLLEGLGLPTVLVQEGGYDLPSLADLLAAILTPFNTDGGTKS
jgi:acetoin utilization deacetylase AcuC-like enzyme